MFHFSFPWKHKTSSDIFWNVTLVWNELANSLNVNLKQVIAYLSDNSEFSKFLDVLRWYWRGHKVMSPSYPKNNLLTVD